MIPLRTSAWEIPRYFYNVPVVLLKEDVRDSRLTIVEVIRDIHVFLVGGAVCCSFQNDRHISAIRRVPFRLDVSGREKKKKEKRREEKRKEEKRKIESAFTARSSPRRWRIIRKAWKEGGGFESFLRVLVPSRPIVNHGGVCYQKCRKARELYLPSDIPCRNRDPPRGFQRVRSTRNSKRQTSYIYLSPRSFPRGEIDEITFLLSSLSFSFLPLSGCRRGWTFI